MKNPYEVLNVKPTDSLEDVKKAYRGLAKKYHPDNYVGNELADLAQEKMKAINEAYETIVRERNGGDNQSTWNPHTSGGSDDSRRVRDALQSGRYAEAGAMLDAMGRRDAEWHYLYGVLHYRRGWYDEASRYFEQAASMEPGNMEYRQAVGQMRGGQRQNSPMGRSGSDCGLCDICAGLMCLDCMCNCC